MGDEGHDGDAGVATDDGHVDVGGVETLELGDEFVGANDVEGGDTEDARGINAGLLVDLSSDRNGAAKN